MAAAPSGSAARILGIDPGTLRLGYGLVEARGGRLAFLDAGVLVAPANDPLASRLATLARGLRALLERHRPGQAAVEDVFVRNDPRAALAIGHARGAILSVLGEAGLTVSSYAPATIKRAVAGNGRALKPQVARMVGAILGLAAPPTPLDATDALATAITHALRSRTQALAEQGLTGRRGGAGAGGGMPG
ncbi:MAG: crossover junction endodeoxyribonuclease RuvC [Planctomycetaceae bacterium]